ncbi:hypothetical protein SSOG_07445 [Streptomyces himastatinicus ATCC 53653]|uniref:DUF202 domain-containing protein n=1 Tax=Streptomyces himastatinicus ATCC 53653 TaxID=457427 RepID=D9WKP1_9ACTN|nr:DUF202 domain-containing protein [Streptomyces himastatinicus]EFL27731.1 hypothetical protein SSOG_07445 [Streptomyces himastatinicus ATCC 53653]
MTTWRPSGTTPHPAGPRDPGLQAERTALARRRTALSALVAATLTLRFGLTHDAPLVTTAGACLMATAALTLRSSGIGRHRLRAVASCATVAGLVVTAQAALLAH